MDALDTGESSRVLFPETGTSVFVHDIFRTSIRVGCSVTWKTQELLQETSVLIVLNMSVRYNHTGTQFFEIKKSRPLYG